MTILLPDSFASFLSRLLNSSSSVTNSSRLNPPIRRKADASQKMNDPAQDRVLRLIQFQTTMASRPANGDASSFTVLPPARQSPLSIALARSEKSSGGG